MARIRNCVSKTGFVNKLPSQRVLQELFRYDERRGHLYWRFKINSAVKLGVPIGSKQYAKGKRAMVRINKILYYVSRVIWKLVTGKDPGSKEVDHDDRNHCNDKWKNLKLVTRRQNLANSIPNYEPLRWITSVRHKYGTLNRRVSS